MTDKKKLTTTGGAPVPDNQNSKTAGPRGPMLLEDIWFLEKLAHFDREVIPERRMHAKGSGAFGTFTVTHDITKYTKARIFSQVGKKTELFARFSTVAGERGTAGAERDNHDERPRDPGQLPPHARLRQPHVQLHHPQQRALLGQVPPALPAGHQEPDRRRGRGARRQGPRKPPARPLREHREGRLPALDDVHPGDARAGCGEAAVPPVRPDQGLVPQGLPAHRGGRHGAQQEPGELSR